MKSREFYTRTFCPSELFELNVETYQEVKNCQYYTERLLVENLYNESSFSKVRTEYPVQVILDGESHNCRVDCKVTCSSDDSEHFVEMNGDCHFYGWKDKAGNWSTEADQRESWRRFFGKMDNIKAAGKNCLIINMLIPFNHPNEDIQAKYRTDQQKVLRKFYISKQYREAIRKLKTSKNHVVVNLRYQDTYFFQYLGTGVTSLNQRIEKMIIQPDFTVTI